ncbi:MAG TPA: hypothetical protein VE999_21000 [Gemmataceae bacterium]|nr:hypothetical protein [Gemmataceae bacterium]
MNVAPAAFLEFDGAADLERHRSRAVDQAYRMALPLFGDLTRGVALAQSDVT